MVKTRHSGGDIHDDVGERVDHSAAVGTMVTRSSHNDGVQVKSSNMNGFGGESSDDDTGQYDTRRRHKRARHRFVGSSSNRSSDSDSSVDNVPPSPHTGHRKLVSPGCSSSQSLPRSQRRHHRHVEAMNHDYDVGVRRSMRQRKFTYDTFNQNAMIDGVSQGDSTEADESRDVDQEEEAKILRRSSRRVEVVPPPDADDMDMYTRVKRERRPVKRDMYGIPIKDDSKDKTSSSSSTETENEDENKKSEVKSYNLRVHCPKTNLYKAPPIEPRGPPRGVKRDGLSFHELRSSRSSRGASTYRSPMRRHRKRAAFHSSDSSSTDSDDEERFERRKSRSMAMARQRCLPMNLTKDDVAAGILRDRVHAGASLADIEPMAIDKSVMFDKVGGLDKHIRALKEMIVFPLLYPEIFTRFKITPPRGVLFYGPPGTGKTLVARALANECSSSDTKVAFFMRKGADCLSKWVGESERQLRLLFDQAYQMRPSIIFFDEIDGLAPVRSSRQDQIHSSIVSTLLALMDGLDDRGEIVVIGATNRIDSIDPALRRPGRFDREFLFPLPPYKARHQILSIHTKEWNPPLSQLFIAEMARRTVGYCGADIKALCTEAALRALRRRYPQIYNSHDKLQIDVSSVNIAASDFFAAMKRIVPSSQRSVTSPARPLSACIRPLLQQALMQAIKLFERIFPCSLSLVAGSTDAGPPANDGGSDDEIVDDSCSIYEDHSTRPLDGFAVNRSVPPTHRPRLLLSGERGQGQSTYLGPAVLHHLECLPVHVLDLAALYAVSAKTPEEACTQILREAQRSSPSVIYMPHLNDWWHTASESVRATFITFLNDLDPAIPILLLATTDVEFKRLPSQVRELFSELTNEVFGMHNPSDAERREFFEDLLLQRTCDLPPIKTKPSCNTFETLPKAQKPEPRKLTPSELKRLHEQEEATLRELRLFLRDTINKLARDRKFNVFAKPVDVEDVPDYYEIIKNPMDLSTMMTKIDLHKYQTVQQFMNDINLICCNALEYNPDRDPQDRAIRHRACALKDTAQAIISAELDMDFEKLCEDIQKARERRGEQNAEAPSFYFTKPLDGLNQPATDCPQRYSRRVRGLNATNDPPDTEGNKRDQPQSHVADSNEKPPHLRMVTKRIRFRRTNTAKSRSSSIKSPWCKGRRRPMYKKVVVYIDEHGREVPGPNSAENKASVAAENVTAATPAEKQLGSCSSVKKNSTPITDVLDNDINDMDSPTLGSQKKRTARELNTPRCARLTESCETSQGGTSTHCRGIVNGSDAGAELETKVQALIIDHSHCNDLLVRTVMRTQGSSVEALMRLHNQMSVCIYQHRHNYDKKVLLEDLEHCLQQYVDSQRNVKHTN